MTAKSSILEHLSKFSWLAIHEFQIYGVSQNSIGSRLPELALDGKVISRMRKGTSYKEWNIPPKIGQLSLDLREKAK